MNRAILRIQGDRGDPIMETLLDPRFPKEEMLCGLVEVTPFNSYPLAALELKPLGKTDLKELDEISQRLQDAGYEEVSKFLDCSLEL